MLSNNLQLKTVTFTEKEASVISLMAIGLTDHEISTKLHISKKYVSTFLRRVISKHSLHNRYELVAVFVNSFYSLSTFSS